MVRGFGGPRDFPFFSRQFNEVPSPRLSELGAGAPESALLLARAMEGTEQPGPLSQALAEGRAGNLREAWSALSSSQQSEIRVRFGEEAVEEMLSISAERSLELAGEALLSLGMRLENEDRLDAASGIFASLLGVLSEGPLRERSRTHLDAILGRGAVLPRMEFLARRFASQATDPAMIVGMAGAGLAFRMARLATLGRLSAGTGVFSRPLLARSLANVVGFGAESVAFTGSVRAANAALGRTQDWSARALWQEYAGGALTLGALKMTGALARLGLSRIGPNPSALARFSQVALPQVAMFGGILLSHSLEARLDLRPHVDGATTFTDALGTLLQFHVGGRLAHHVSGEGFRRMERELDQRQFSLERQWTVSHGVYFERPLRDRLPEGLRTLARRLRHGVRSALYAPMWMTMGVGPGGGIGAPPQRIVERRVLRVDSSRVQVEISHHEEIPRATLQGLERGLRQIFEQGEAPVEFDGEAENLAAERHYVLQRLRNGGPTMRANLRMTALGTILGFEISEEGRTPFRIVPESETASVVEAREPTESMETFATLVSEEITPLGTAATDESAKLLSSEVLQAPVVEETTVTEMNPDSAAPEAQPQEALVTPAAAEFPALDLAEEAVAPLLSEEEPLAEAELNTEVAVPEESLAAVPAELAPPNDAISPPRPAFWAPPGMRLRPSHRRLMGVSPEVQMYEPIPKNARERPTPSHEYALDWEVEALLEDLETRIQGHDTVEAGGEVFRFLLHYFGEYAQEWELPSESNFRPESRLRYNEESYSENEGNRWAGESAIPETPNLFSYNLEAGSRFRQVLEQIAVLIRRKGLGPYLILDQGLDPFTQPHPLLRAAYSSMYLREWEGNAKIISLEALVRKLLATFSERQETRGIIDPITSLLQRANRAPRSEFYERTSTLRGTEASSSSPGNEVAEEEVGDSRPPELDLEPPVSNEVEAEPMPEARQEPGADVLSPPALALSNFPSPGPTPNVEWRSVYDLLDSIQARLAEQARLNPLRDQAARRRWFGIRGLQQLGVRAATVLEVARLFGRQVESGETFKSLSSEFFNARCARILGRLTQLPQEAGMVRRVRGILPDLKSENDTNYLRAISSLDVLEQIVERYPQRLSAERWDELLDIFEVCLRTQASFSTVLDRLSAMERRSSVASREQPPSVEVEPSPSEPSQDPQRPATILPETTEDSQYLAEEISMWFRDAKGHLYPGDRAQVLEGRGASVFSVPRPAWTQGNFALSIFRSFEGPNRLPVLRPVADSEAPVDEILELRERLSGRPRAEAAETILSLLLNRMGLSEVPRDFSHAESRRSIARLPRGFVTRIRGLIRELGLSDYQLVTAGALQGMKLSRAERRRVENHLPFRTMGEMAILFERFAPKLVSAPASTRASRVLRNPVSPQPEAEVVQPASVDILAAGAPFAAAEEFSPHPIESRVVPESRPPSLDSLPDVSATESPFVAEGPVLAAPLPPRIEVDSGPELLFPEGREAEVEIELPAEATEAPEPTARPTPTPPRPSPIPENSRLANLLPDETSLPLAQVENYYRANPLQRRMIVPPTLAQFAAARSALEARLLRVEGTEAHAIRSTLRALDQALREPSAAEVLAYNRGILGEMDAALCLRFNALSEGAQRGLYLLGLALTQAQRGNLRVFLASPGVARLPGGADTVLNRIALLHDLGVRGYERGIVPAARDMKYLSVDESALGGIQAEYLEAQRLASHPSVDRVWMGTPLRIRWHRMSEAQRNFIETELQPHLYNPSYDYQAQQTVETDLLYRHTSGARRLVEVKTSRRSNYSPGSEEASRQLLQIIRHGLLVHQQGLEGLEYRITAPSVDPAWTARLRQTLDLTGAPYVLELHETATNRRQIFENGLLALRGDGAAGLSRQRPLPALPRGTTGEEEVVAALSSSSAEPWNEDMIGFLNEGLEGQDKLSRRLSREEAMSHLINHLRIPPQQRMANHIDAFLRGSGSSLPEPRRARIAELLRQFRFFNGNTMSRGRSGMILEMAGLAVGAIRSPEEIAAEGRALFQGVERNISANASLWEHRLTDWYSSLEALEDLAEVMNSSDIAKGLEEYSVDQIVDISVDGAGRGGRTLRQLQEDYDSGLLRIEPSVAERIKQLVELYDALRGMSHLRDD